MSSFCETAPGGWVPYGTNNPSRFAKFKKTAIWRFFLNLPDMRGSEPPEKGGSTAEKRRAGERRFCVTKFFKDSARCNRSKILLVSTSYKKAEVYTFAFFVIQFPCKALGQPTAEKWFYTKIDVVAEIFPNWYILLPEYIYLVQCDFFARATWP